MKLSELFTLHANDLISPKQDMRMGGFFMSKSSTMSRNTTLNGLHLVQAWDKEVDTITQNGVLIIQGVKT